MHRQDSDASVEVICESTSWVFFLVLDMSSIDNTSALGRDNIPNNPRQTVRKNLDSCFLKFDQNLIYFHWGDFYTKP